MKCRCWVAVVVALGVMLGGAGCSLVDFDGFAAGDAAAEDRRASDGGAASPDGRALVEGVSVDGGAPRNGGGALADGGAPMDATTDGPAGGNKDGGVVWSNGHTYLVVRATLTWAQAKAQATMLGGHLVTLTTSEENLFVHGLLMGDSSKVCIGAEQAPGSPEPAAGWGWITGEPMSFKAWASGQPGNNGGNEDVAIFSSTTPTPVWGDLGRDVSTNGFVVEFE